MPIIDLEGQETGSVTTAADEKFEVLDGEFEYSTDGGVSFGRLRKEGRIIIASGITVNYRNPLDRASRVSRNSV